MKKILIFLCSILAFSQTDKSDLGNLKANANAVILNYDYQINIQNQQKYVTKSIIEAVVFNRLGSEVVDFTEFYSKSSKIKSIKAEFTTLSDAKVKKISKKDFKDFSAGDGFSIFNDNRVLSYDYTPTSYPYLIVYEVETESSNTAFLPFFAPFTSYNLAIKNAKLTVNYPPDLGFKFQKYNFEGYEFNEKNENNTLEISLKNILAINQEYRSPSAINIFPKVRLALNKFHLEGSNGVASSWEELSQWYYKELIKPTLKVPQSVKDYVVNLTAGVTDPIEKAKIVYEFMQEKTRYVSIQVGIGGWQPMLVSDVDRLGYGDCKALSNYTMALLKEVGVEAYFTVVYANPQYPRSFDDDIVCLQGNHAILAIPHNNDYIWLECTSKTNPFGYQGDFTDNRKVLVVKENNGEIVNTKLYENQDNLLFSKANVSVDASGNIQIATSNSYHGSFFDSKGSFIKEAKKDIEKNYLNRWSFLGVLKIEDFSHQIDKDKLFFNENINMSVSKYAKKMGNEFAITTNVLNNDVSIPPKENRKLSLVVYRGFLEKDEITYKFPDGININHLPQNVNLNSDFGNYMASFEKVDDNTVVYKREYLLKRGEYAKEKYDAYRNFIESVNRHDQSKIIYTLN